MQIVVGECAPSYSIQMRARRRHRYAARRTPRTRAERGGDEYDVVGNMARDVMREDCARRAMVRGINGACACGGVVVERKRACGDEKSHEVECRAAGHGTKRRRKHMHAVQKKRRAKRGAMSAYEKECGSGENAVVGKEKEKYAYS